MPDDRQGAPLRVGEQRVGQRRDERALGDLGRRFAFLVQVLVPLRRAGAVAGEVEGDQAVDASVRREVGG